MPIDWKSLVTGLLAGVIGWIAAGALTIGASAITGGTIIHWMGGVTKADIKELEAYQFGGLYTKASSTTAPLSSNQFGNALYGNQQGCPPHFSQTPLTRILLDSGGGSYADIYVCTRAPQSLK